MKLRNVLFPIFICLLLCALLTGCHRNGGTDPAPSEPLLSWPASGILSPTENDPRYSRDVFFNVAETDDMLVGIPMLGGSIVYYDKYTGVSGVLCGRPECTHADESCNSYIGTSFNPLLTAYDGKLYWNGEGTAPGESGTVYGIWSMDQDGTNRRLVLRDVELENGLGALYNMAIHRDKIYLFTESQSVEEATPVVRHLLVSTDLKKPGVFTVLFERNNDQTLTSRMLVRGDWVYFLTAFHASEDPEELLFHVLLERCRVETGEKETLLDLKNAPLSFNNLYVTEQGEVYLSGNGENTLGRVFRVENGKAVLLFTLNDGTRNYFACRLSEGFFYAYATDETGRMLIWYGDMEGNILYRGPFVQPVLEEDGGRVLARVDFGGEDTYDIFYVEANEKYFLRYDFGDGALKETVLWSSRDEPLPIPAGTVIVTPAEPNPALADYESDNTYRLSSGVGVAETEDLLLFRPLNDHRLFGYDKTTGRAGILCQVPGCGHTDITCAADLGGAACKFLTAVGDKVYWLGKTRDKNSDGGTDWALYRMSLDGTEHRLLRNLSPVLRASKGSKSIRDAVLHRGKLYVLLTHMIVPENGTTPVITVQVLAAEAEGQEGGFTILLERTGVNSLNCQMALSGDWLYLYDFELVRKNLTTGQEELLLRAEDEPWSLSDLQVSPEGEVWLAVSDTETGESFVYRVEDGRAVPAADLTDEARSYGLAKVCQEYFFAQSTDEFGRNYLWFCDKRGSTLYKGLWQPACIGDDGIPGLCGTTHFGGPGLTDICYVSDYMHLRHYLVRLVIAPNGLTETVLWESENLRFSSVYADLLPEPTEIIPEFENLSDETPAGGGLSPRAQAIFDYVTASPAALTGACGNGITWHYLDGVLVFRGSGELTDWNEPTIMLYDRVSRLIVGEGITAISGKYMGTEVFQYLWRADLPRSLTRIGDLAFSDCVCLYEVTIPPNVTEIGERAFGSCASLRTLELPEAVTTLGEQAFSGCMRLTSFTVPRGVTELPISVFSFCYALREAALPETVTAIRNGAFAHCTALETVVIPNGSARIDLSAFTDCTSLRQIVCGTETFASTDDLFAWLQSR